MKLRKVTKTYAGLFLFGLIFNFFVGQLRDRYPRHGYTALLVVAGNLITLIALIPRIGSDAFVSILLGFVASGAPMVLGDIYRNLESGNGISQSIQDTLSIVRSTSFDGQEDEPNTED